MLDFLGLPDLRTGQRSDREKTSPTRTSNIGRTMTAIASPTVEPRYGALVVSLDFELHWGIRDNQRADGPYRQNLLGARRAIPRILDLFEEFDIGATWATVGFLFAHTQRELVEFSPKKRPEYQNKALDAYQEVIGADEKSDPLHFAPSLIAEIRRRPRQELATHTFSHYYCQEAGQTEETFREDLQSAVKIAAQSGVKLRSIVFPRNQYAEQYNHVLREFGITSYRGTERHRMYEGSSRERQRAVWRRGARILDNYLNISGPNTTEWRDIPGRDGLCNIPSSRFLRPYSKPFAAFEPLRLCRILNALDDAAHSQRIFHLNCHPPTSRSNLQDNLQVR